MSERRFGRLSGFKAGMTAFIAAPVAAAFALSGCATSPVEFGSGSPEELDLAQEISLREFEANLAPEESDGRNDVEVRRVEIDDLSMAHTHVQQTFRGVRVFGGEAIVHLNRDGSYRDATDSLVRGIPRSLNTTPKLSVREASDLVVAKQECPACLTAAPEVDLFILPQGREMKLAYRVSLRREDGTDKTSMPVVFVDAHTGEKLLEFDNLQTGTGPSLYSGNVSFGTSASGGKYYLEDTTRRLGTYSYRNTQIALFVLTDTDDVWAQDAAMDAQWGASKVYDYYKNVHGRDGILGNNGSGSITATANSSIKLVASGVHYGVNYTQAYWDGSMMRYGDGDGSTFLPLVSLDLCAHEMTHGVIQSTANLTYQGESGALSEGIADIFAALIELSVKGDAN
jgi:Zn-dependent metalloprotease